MNKYLSNIPLNEILKQINMTDLNQINTVELRNMIRSSVNLEELEKRITLNCIDDLEKKMNTNLFYELLGEFFEPKGYSEDLVKEQEIYKITLEQFYDKLFEFEEFDDELVSEIQNMREKNKDFSVVKDFLGNWIESYSELEELFQTTEEKLDFINDKFIELFKNYIFNGPRGNQNAKEYLGVVEQYVDEYVDNEELSNDFHNCVKKIGQIKTLLGVNKPLTGRGKGIKTRTGIER